MYLVPRASKSIPSCISGPAISVVPLSGMMPQAVLRAARRLPGGHVRSSVWVRSVHLHHDGSGLACLFSAEEAEEVGG